MTTVLVTCAGGVAVPGIIRHLQRAHNFRVVAVDADAHAAGLFVADAAYVVPRGGSWGFFTTLRSICQRESVSIVVPLADEELVLASKLRMFGVKVLAPSTTFISQCIDKYVCMTQLSNHDIPHPHTTLLCDARPDEFNFPFVVKPRRGHGSRGFAIIDGAHHFDYYMRECHDTSAYIAQDMLEGEEFTVSVVVDSANTVFAVVPKRVICKRGVTRIAVTEINDDITQLCTRIALEMHACGLFNVQLVLDKATNTPMPFEINPRFSTTTSLTLAAGVDEIGGLIRHELGIGATSFSDSWKTGLVLLRQTMDEFRTYGVEYNPDCVVGAKGRNPV